MAYHRLRRPETSTHTLDAGFVFYAAHALIYRRKKALSKDGWAGSLCPAPCPPVLCLGPQRRHPPEVPCFGEKAEMPGKWHRSWRDDGGKVGRWVPVVRGRGRSFLSQEPLIPNEAKTSQASDCAVSGPGSEKQPRWCRGLVRPSPRLCDSAPRTAIRGSAARFTSLYHVSWCSCLGSSSQARRGTDDSLKCAVGRGWRMSGRAPQHLPRDPGPWRPSPRRPGSLHSFPPLQPAC